MSADSGSVDEIALALEEGRDMTEELPGETIYPREGIFEVSRLCPNTRSLQYDFIELCQEAVRKRAVGCGSWFKPVYRVELRNNW